MNFDKRIDEWVLNADRFSLDDIGDGHGYKAMPEHVGSPLEGFGITRRAIDRARHLMCEMLAEIKRLGGTS